MIQNVRDRRNKYKKNSNEELNLKNYTSTLRFLFLFHNIGKPLKHGLMELVK